VGRCLTLKEIIIIMGYGYMVEKLAKAQGNAFGAPLHQSQ